MYARISPGQGGNAVYRILIGDGNKSVVYANGGGPLNGGMSAFSQTLLLNVGEDPNARIVRVWGDNGNLGAPAPATVDAASVEAFIEYY